MIGRKNYLLELTFRLDKCLPSNCRTNCTASTFALQYFNVILNVT